MEDAESAARAAHDIDSTNFSVNNYVTEQLSKSPLPDLMAFQNQMSAETRSLDRDMQDLVYNNYNKFISATDTIRRMRDSVGEMEASMSRLGSEMRAMGGSSALVNENLQENRGKIESLVGVKRLLVKLEFLFELPMRLRRAMELDALAQAVRYFTTVRAVLQKYDSMPSIHAIHVEARAIMDKLRDQLRGVLKSGARNAASSTSASAAKVVEAIRLLVALDEPRKPLREDFLAFQRGRLLGALAKAAERYAPAGVNSAPTAAAAVAAPAFSTDSASGTALLSERARTLAAAAMAARAAAAAAPTSVAAARPRAPVPHAVFVQFVNRLFLDAFRYAADLYVELFEGEEEAGVGAAPGAGAQTKSAAHDDLLGFTREVMGAYFSTLRRQLSLPPPLTGDADAAAGASDGKQQRARAAVAAKASTGSRAADAAPLSPPRPDADDDEAEAAREKAASGLEAVTADLMSGGAVSRYEAVCDALKMVLTDVRAASRHVKEACLPDRAHEAVESILRAQLDGLFGDVRGAVVRLLISLEEKVRDVIAAEAQNAAGKDWAPAVGRSLAEIAEESSGDISARIDDALQEAKPLILAAMRLLPDLARSFTGLVHAQVFALVSWLSAAWEAAGDAAHPSRAEWHEIVVEADVGLDNDAAASSGSGSSSRARSTGADAGAARALRRTLVNYSVPEADQNAPVPAFNGTGGGILSPERERTHALLLLLAALAKTFAHSGVARALTTMIQSLPTRSNLAAMGIGALALGADDSEGYGSMGGVPDLIRRVEAAGRELLRRFAFLHGARLSAVVRAALMTPQWAAAPEPRAVRDVVRVVLEDIAANKRLVAATLGTWDAAAAMSLSRFCGANAETAAGGSGSATSAASAAPTSESNPFAPTPSPATLKGPAAGASAAALSSVASSRRTGTVVCAAGLGPALGSVNALLGARGGLSRALPVDMDRIFSATPARRDGAAAGFASPNPTLAGGGLGGGGAPRHVLGAVSYSADSVARALLRLLLKSWIEWTRATVLGAHGLQQLQIDLAAIHMCLPVLTSSAAPPPTPSQPFDAFAHATSLEELIHEAALSAGERCTEHRPVEPAVMLQIATASISAYDFVTVPNAIA